MLVLVAMSPTARCLEPAVSGAVERIAKVDQSGQSMRQASAAAETLAELPSSEIVGVLKGFDEATPRGKNWLRAVVADVSENGPFPQSQLNEFFGDRENDPDARYVAFQLLVQHDPGIRDRLLSDAETDPSLPVRYLKVEKLLAEASQLRDDQPESSKQILRTVVEHARSPKQLESAAEELEELGEEVDLANELGMIRQWWLIGPFDNTDTQNFDTAYTPEQRYLESGSPIARTDSGDPAAEKGKRGTVQWQRISSDDELGMVDLNAPLSGEKDAAAYVFTRFRVDGPLECPTAEARLGCINANKLWINGQLVLSNEVYHSGSRIDQYVDDCQLVDGENTVLIKVLQNAQTEPWAQDWEFQFRLTRPDGSAIATTPLE